MLSSHTQGLNSVKILPKDKQKQQITEVLL